MTRGLSAYALLRLEQLAVVFFEKIQYPIAFTWREESAFGCDMVWWRHCTNGIGIPNSGFLRTF
jgi:hypothetical protein